MKGEIIIKEVDISQLTPHPKNLEIYGDEDVSELASSIEKMGLRQPITITDNNVIISGHRRAKAYQVLGYPTIPATVQHYDSVEDEIEDLILINHTRVRSKEQMAREAAMLEEVEKQRAEIRRLSTQNNNSAKTHGADVTELSPLLNQGKSRDKVAEKIGFKSGIEASRAIKTIQKIDELKKKETPTAKTKLNFSPQHSINTAYQPPLNLQKLLIRYKSPKRKELS